MKKEKQFETDVFFSRAYIHIPDITQLNKLGIGHDGAVFGYGDLALKTLKYDIDQRKEKNLMTFEKAKYIITELSLRRVSQPIDILLTQDGIYTGYVMKKYDDVRKEPYTNKNRTFVMSDLENVINDLESDFADMSDKHVIVDDINRGSYIVTSDYLVMCDMDKFRIMPSCKTAHNLNKGKLNFYLSKWLFYEMLNGYNFTKEDKKNLIKWVRNNTNSRTFTSELRTDCLIDPNYPVREYALEIGKSLIK